MHLVLPFFIFIHLHLAYHLGTLDAPREGQDVEPNLKMVFGGPISKMEGLNKCKPQSIISLLISKNAIEYICYMYCCIK
jgi:hypothetical protein